MATQQELMQQALAEIKAATISPDEWCRRIRDGYNGKPYNYTATHNYKAQVLLAEAAKASPNPAPPSVRSLGERCVFFSGVSQHAIDQLCAIARACPDDWYRALFSADLNLAKPGEPYWVTEAQIHLLTDAGVQCGYWCDGDQTPIGNAKRLAGERGLTLVCGQFETKYQYDEMIEHGVLLGVGNPSEIAAPTPQDQAEQKDHNWRLDDAIHRVSSGQLAMVGEMMYPDSGYSARGINISSVCPYIDRDKAQGGYAPLLSYDTSLNAGQKKTASLYTGGRASDPDWTVYKEWTKP